MPDGQPLSPDVHAIIARLAPEAAAARIIAVLSGAGISAESGIPTFREAQTGLWTKYDPVMLASPEGFAEDPQHVWQWYDERRQTMRRCHPNPGHTALAAWEQHWREQGRGFRVATQNIDGLHAQAGSQSVIELHGNIWYVRPERGGMRDAQPLLDCPLTVIPPRNNAGRLLRPHVVWFGEALDPAVLGEAIKLAEVCDLMFVVGTSSLVYPAAALPFAALRRRTTVVEINPNETELSQHATYVLRGESGVVLPALWEQVLAILDDGTPG